MRSKWDDFMAGLGFMFLAVTVVSVIEQVGEMSEPEMFTWSDAAWALFMLGLWAVVAVDIYKFFKRLK